MPLLRSVVVRVVPAGRSDVGVLDTRGLHNRVRFIIILRIAVLDLKRSFSLFGGNLFRSLLDDFLDFFRCLLL